MKIVQLNIRWLSILYFWGTSTANSSKSELVCAARLLIVSVWKTPPEHRPSESSIWGYGICSFRTRYPYLSCKRKIWKYLTQSSKSGCHCLRQPQPNVLTLLYLKAMPIVIFCLIFNDLKKSEGSIIRFAWCRGDDRGYDTEALLLQGHTLYCMFFFVSMLVYFVHRTPFFSSKYWQSIVCFFVANKINYKKNKVAFYLFLEQWFSK